MNEFAGILIFSVTAIAVALWLILELLGRLFPATVEDDPPARLSTVSPPPPAHYVKSPAPLSADTAPDPGLSDGLSALSEVEALALEDIRAYRSRENLVCFLVAFGWKTGEIRAILKGDSGKIGEEVREARVLLGLEDEEVPRTPLAGRPIPAGVVFQED